MELTRFTSYRGLSVRSIFTFALAIFMMALLWAIFAPTASAAEGNWNGQSIQYEQRQYLPAATEAKTGESHGLTAGTTYYLSIEKVSDRPLVQKAYLIYFAPGVDPPTATSAQYAVYDYSAAKEFSNPRDQATIVLNLQSEETTYNSCNVEGGLGWAICPISVFLADGIDGIFGILAEFIAVQPPTTGDTSDQMYIAWNIMRSIANVAFIIAFMIIIYSQLTNLGISNYGLKKLIPRLVVAAVLVNLSYYICAAAIDLSNILGYSVQDLLNNIRHNTFSVTGDTLADASTPTWKPIVEYALSGGAAVAGGISLIASTGGNPVVLIYMLIPIMLGLVLTVVFVLLILAARQAIIIILIIIAPLAFVANLLPNTEKWFEKWRDLFMTMLVFFPAFSLVFGGSQLAGGIIIQNATSVFMMVFGMAVQIAPLVITPLILKLSGGLLGKIAGLVNDPRKGLMDRTKNWSNDRAQMHKEESLGRRAMRFSPRGIAQSMDNGNRRVKQRTETAKLRGDNRYNTTAAQQGLHADHYDAHRQGEIIENDNKQHLQNQINTRGTALHQQNLDFEVSKIKLEGSMKATEADLDEYRSGRVAVTGELSRLANELRSTHEQVALEAMRSKSGKDTADQNWSKRFLSQETLQVYAGGVGGEQAASVAVASAIATQNKAFGENVAAARSLADHFKLTTEDRTNLATGEKQTVQGKDANNNVRTFSVNDEFIREVAITDTIKAAPYADGARLIAMSGKDEFTEFRSAIIEAMEAANWEGKGAFYDGETRDMVRRGKADDAYLDMRAAEFIVNGKISADVLGTNHKSSIDRYIKVAKQLAEGKITVAASKYDPRFKNNPNLAIDQLQANALKALEDPIVSARMGDRTASVEKLRDRNL